MIHLYACGGCGINVAQELEGHRTLKEVGWGQLGITYVDLSESDFRRHSSIDPANRYLIDEEGVDGSGQVRNQNDGRINKHVRQVLQKHPAGDLNIVLFSGSGGSGSVFGPFIARELLSQEKPTVVIVIGDRSTVKFAENTRGTIKTLENIATKINRPVVMMYRDNSDQAIKIINDEVRAVILALTALFSGENHGLDSRDLYNWLSYNEKGGDQAGKGVTKFPASLVSLLIEDKVSKITPDHSIGNLITVATLAIDHTTDRLENYVPNYQVRGYLPAGASGYIIEHTPIHFMVVDGEVPEIMNGLNKFISGLNDRFNASIKRDSILSRDDVVTDNDLVL